jgi:histidine triad (HIT) family protein
MMENCIFCKIADGSIPCAKVHEDKDVMGFLDISPANKGHALIIPKAHYETLSDIPTDELGRLMGVVKQVAMSVQECLFADGYNIIMNNRPEAGQVVPHAHIHIIPRFRQDGIKIGWPHRRYGSGEAETLAKRIRNDRD